jgi:hypothetical protein
MGDGGISVLHALLGIVSGALTAAAAVVAAVASFELSPIGPVLVCLAALAGGVLGAGRAREIILRAAAIGLIVGGLLAILLWPLFSVDSAA